jgi:predicted Ser/Thr protein kinase
MTRRDPDDATPHEAAGGEAAASSPERDATRPAHRAAKGEAAARTPDRDATRPGHGAARGEAAAGRPERDAGRSPHGAASAETVSSQPGSEPEDDAPLSAAFARAWSLAPPAVLARARIAGALFGAEAGLGRFRVLERLGGGGMGVVYAAYDPELDRGVALKTVQVPQAGRELALREAKALAKLAHPNVVPVFDVGIEEDHVYIVMELVRGTTLRAWVADKAQREILDVYRQAGQALAAAHDAGLVHRDFKPDNAMVDDAGRVRVVDFGLACEAMTGGSSGARAVGTPRYMAPEQAAGAPATPAADQYSFSTSLDEALRGDASRAVPRWIEQVIERGAAADPAARFASMSELLRALARDPARVRRRRVALGLAAAVVAAAFVVGRTTLSDRPALCSGGDRAIASAWEPEARAGELRRIAGLSSYGGEQAGELGRQLDDYAARWAAAHRDACLAHQRGEQSAAMLDRRMACLARSREALATLAKVTAAADAKALPGVATAVRALPAPDGCGPLQLLHDDQPPRELAAPVDVIRTIVSRTRLLIAAGHAGDAQAEVRGAVGLARGVGYGPALAEALVVEGQALMTEKDRGPALAALTEALTLGLSTGAHAIAIEAWARRTFLRGTGAGPEAALDGLEEMEPLSRSVASPFARAMLHNSVGAFELGRLHRAAARGRFERALAEARPVTGPQAVELMVVRTNQAIATDDVELRDRLFEEAGGELARLFGADHPDVLFARSVRIKTSVISLVTAEALLASVCGRYETHAWLTSTTAVCWVELADLRSELADPAGATTALDRALALGAATNPSTPEADGYGRLLHGEPRAAVARFEAALAGMPPRTDEPVYRTYARARLTLGLGRALAAAGEPRAAVEQLDRAAALLAPLARDLHAVAVDRRLARARGELARSRAAIAAPAELVRAPASDALAWYRSSDAPRKEIAALELLAATSADRAKPDEGR